MEKFLLIARTVSYLKLQQVFYQIFYWIKKQIRKKLNIQYPLFVDAKSEVIKFFPFNVKTIFLKNETFTFLNQSVKNPSFKNKMPDTLWAYNFNYMDYLLQPEMDERTGLKFIQQFINELPENKIGFDSYPISLRGINWIKFISKCKNDRKSEAINEATDDLSKKINSSLYAQYRVLFANPEYHLMGNHLLENGFSLLFGAFYFRDIRFYRKSRKIIYAQLNEQILNDGAHFELSPMYHQILLGRLLDCINLLQNNSRFENQPQLLSFMQKKAADMLAWLKKITFSNGEIPLLNDAAIEIAPNTNWLNNYAENLNINTSEVNYKLSDSGYRKFSNTNYECVVDIGQIGPSYQPGHAHADTFSFVVNHKQKPLIVDTGVSTYNSGAIRLKERGTAAHNTITILEKNSSQVWSSFRVASRAKIEVLKDEKERIIARHYGYKKLRAIHQREWEFFNTQIEITDTLYGNIKKGKAHIWFSQTVKPFLNNNSIEANGAIVICKNADNIQLIETKIPNGFNKYSKSYKVEIRFTGQLTTIIRNL